VEANARRLLEVFTRPSGVVIQRMNDYGNHPKLYYRVKTGSPAAWTAWAMAYSPIENTPVDVFTPTVWTSLGENKGINLKVMTYNVAHYNKDTANLMPEAKILNFRKMLMQYNPDAILLQEHGLYVYDNMDSNAVLYMPQFPYDNGSGVTGPNVKSKRQLTNAGSVSYTDGLAAIKYGVITIDNKKILLATTHNAIVRTEGEYDPEASIIARNAEYQQLIKWVSGAITLNNSSSQPTSAPTPCSPAFRRTAVPLSYVIVWIPAPAAC
jgi:hypothetical protein